MNVLSMILAEVHEPAPLVLPIWGFPLIAALFFIVTALITFSYRDVANRHSDKVGTGDGHDGHGAAGHGAGH
jgi:hypothetical protein